jgi:imidazoleglycerol-phosphate dehydratase
MDTQTVARVALAATGEANVATGLPVLDHLVGALARAGRLKVALEVAPDSVDEQVVAAGRSFGRALGDLVRADTAAGTGWAMATADEAFAAASLEAADRPLLAANVEFSGQRVAGIATDVVSRFLEELAGGAGLNLHVRLFEGDDPQHVLLALFKAVGAAAGLACRPPHEGGEG